MTGEVALMSLKDYIKKVIDEFVKAEVQEIPGLKEINFEVGIIGKDGTIVVDQTSTNRLEFTLLVKRK